jgi:transposase-like protein
MIEFQKRYSEEEKCREHMFQVRWPNGFVCPKCGHNEYFDIKSRHLFQCKSCNHQASVTAGTIMDKSKTPLTKWFLAIYLMTEDKRGISALALKKKLGIAYYTAWSMSNKIREALTRHTDRKLDGPVIEIDEAFFGAPTEGGKRGRGTEKAAVMAAVSLTPEGKPLQTKLKAVGTVDGETAVGFVSGIAEKGSEIRTDGLTIYAGIAKNGYTLTQKKYSPKSEPEHLHWIHIIVSNAKALIGGTYHGLDSLHLQRYLGEYCYRFNNRFRKNIFGRAIVDCMNCGIIRCYELFG